MKKRCRKSGKVKYDTFESAWQRAGELLTTKKEFRKTKSISAYRCADCLKVHITTEK